MQVKITTTVETIIDLLPGVTVEEARKEIFSQYVENAEVDEHVEGVIIAQGNCVQFDVIRGTSVSHDFGGPL